MSTSKRAHVLRVRKFAKAVLAGKTYKQAAIDVGYKPSGAEQQGSALAKHPEAQHILSQALDRAGAAVEDTARVIGDAHRAKKAVGLERKLIADHAIRLKAAELALRARRIIGSPEEESKPMQVNILNVIQEAAKNRGLIDG